MRAAPAAKDRILRLTGQTWQSAAPELLGTTKKHKNMKNTLSENLPVSPSANLLDIRLERHELREEMQLLKEKKRVIELQRTKIKNLIRSSGLMPPEKYKQCCNAQSKYAEQIAHNEKRMSEIKLQLQKLADDEQLCHKKPSKPVVAVKLEPLAKECIEALVALREKYQRFAADHTRVSSMRTIAAEFVCQLNPIIKSALKVSPPV